MQEALKSALLSVFPTPIESRYQEVCELVENWAAGDSAAVSTVEELLASAKQTMDVIVDSAFLNAIATIVSASKFQKKFCSQ
jgi:hypothetical protein